jgi:Tol biopolymer transport system component
MASAAFAPDGTSIIYGQGHDVYLMNRDGASPRKLLTVDNIPHWYRFSADAKTLRFSQFDPNGPMNTSMSANADGTGLQKMFKGCCGDWTPDGRFFVFLRAVDGHINFWTLRESKIFSWQKQNHDAHVHEFVPYLSGISAEGLAFSPDGRWVAYTSYPDGILWRSRVDGSERLQLTLPPLKVFMPRWSPDGRQIAFNAALPRAPWNIHVVSSGGGSAERLLPSDQSQGDANWSPDGKSLVFGSAQDPKQSIYILDLSSRRVSTVSGSLGFSSPRWSPDGRYIAGMFSEVQGLVLFDVSTQKWTKVFDGDVDYPMWSHDGKYLYFEFHPAPDKPNRIVRLRLSDRKIENVAEVSSVGRLTTGWFGLTPDGSPLLARDIGTQEIYAIEVEWP